jgi:hypothetical protein
MQFEIANIIHDHETQKIICDYSGNRSFLPDVFNNGYKIKITSICLQHSQTSNYLKYKNETLYSHIPKQVSDPFARYHLLIGLKDFINHEFIASPDYYTVYHATSRMAYFCMQLQTMVRHMVLKKDIYTTIFRQPNKDWFYNENVVTNMKTFKEFALNKLQTNTGELISDDYKYEQDGITNNKHETRFDWFSWFKLFGLSVNFTLASGNPGENSINYLTNSISHTGTEFIVNEVRTVLRRIFDTDQAFDNIMHFYNQFYGQSDDSKSDNFSESVLLQIHIKKEIIDEVLYVSTPYGIPVTDNAGKILDMYQSGNYDELKNHLHTISREHLDTCKNNLSSPNQKFTFDNYLSCGAEYMMKTYGLQDTLKNVQGRFICANEELIVTPGNVIVSSLDKNSFNDNYKFYELYKLMISLLIKYNKINTIEDNLANMDV